MTRTAAARGKRGRLAVSDGFRALVLDNLDGLPSLTARPMFGGLGLYGRLGPPRGERGGAPWQPVP